MATVKKSKAGRPSLYRDEYPAQALKLCRLGATNPELEKFFETQRTEDEWLATCLWLIRQDRFGKKSKKALQKSISRKNNLQQSPSKRVRNSISARMWAALKGVRKDGKLFSRLKYTAEDLVMHLESNFQDGMSWSNYGKWHIDHIKPCALFDLTKELEFEECWSLKNLQPLWAAENMQKGASYASS